jgi:hypothetical protein
MARYVASEPWALYRENPFRVLYTDGRGFVNPPRDFSDANSSRVWKFGRETHARHMANHLNSCPNVFGIRDTVFYAPYPEIIKRIKSHVDEADA